MRAEIEETYYTSLLIDAVAAGMAVVSLIATEPEPHPSFGPPDQQPQGRSAIRRMIVTVVQ